MTAIPTCKRNWGRFNEPRELEPAGVAGREVAHKMLRFVYDDGDAQALLDAFGIREAGRDELTLRPGIPDAERARRGEPPLTRLK